MGKDSNILIAHKRITEPIHNIKGARAFLEKKSKSIDS